MGIFPNRSPIGGPDGQRCGAVVAGIVGRGVKPTDTRCLAEDLRSRQRRAAGYRDECGRELRGQFADVGLKFVDLVG